MKARILALLFLFVGVNSIYGQTSEKYLYKILQSDKERMSDDIYNPINFTTITERMPSENGRISRYKWRSWSSVDYIKKGSSIHIEFKKEFIDSLGNKCDIQILAYLQRKDKSVKPLAIRGFTKVLEVVDNVGPLKQKSLDISDSKDVAYKYSISKENKNKPTYSGEINLAEEHIDEEDKIILYIHNIAANGTGFGQTFVYDDFGWKNGPVGGFSFVKITKSGFSEFSPAASFGYSFRYQPRKSSNFWRHFLSPGFGPMLHAFQNGENTTIGVSLYLSTFCNMVNVGFGSTISGVNHGKPYFSLGLNFIESYNTITKLIK